LGYSGGFAIFLADECKTKKGGAFWFVEWRSGECLEKLEGFCRSVEVEKSTGFGESCGSRSGISL